MSRREIFFTATAAIVLVIYFLYYIGRNFIENLPVEPIIFVALVAALGFFALVFISISTSSHMANLLKNLQSAAKELGGTFKHFSFLWLGPLTFRFNGRECSIMFKASRREEASVFSCPLRRDFSIEISKRIFEQKWLSFPTKPFGYNEVSSGNLEFDQKYSAFGKDEYSIRAFLGNTDNRMGIEALLKDFISFSIKNKTLKLTAPGFDEKILKTEKIKEVFNRAAKLLGYIEEKQLGH